MQNIVLAATMLIFGMVGSASALTFSNTEILDITLGEGPFASVVFPSSVTYSHATPLDFEVPWDIVNSATLSISGYFIDNNNDTVSFEQTFIGTLMPGGIYAPEVSSLGFVLFPEVDAPSVSVFDISTSFSSWTTGAPFDVTITADGNLFDGGLYLSSSTFDLNYDNESAPVPEPSTILLMGAGLFGLVGYNRKRSNKKS